jgi:hypothetical protein
MKTTPKFFRTAALMAVMLLAAISCKKDSSSSSSQTADENTTISLATSSTGAESMYDDAFDVVTESSEQSGVSTNTVAGQTVNAIGATNYSYVNVACATVTLAPATVGVFPKTLTIDYGTAGCTSNNGVTRKGSLSVTLTGPMRTPGTVVTVVYNNYSVNGYVLAGTYSLTSALASGGGINYTITVANGSITLPAGGVYSYSGTETYTQVAGIGTSTVTDDSYNITGNFTYSGNGTSITGIIVTPLVRSADCANITSGTIDFTYKNISGLLDFGQGTCDNLATVKVGLTTKTITLPR